MGGCFSLMKHIPTVSIYPENVNKSLKQVMNSYVQEQLYINMNRNKTLILCAIHKIILRWFLTKERPTKQAVDVLQCSAPTGLTDTLNHLCTVNTDTWESRLWRNFAGRRLWVPGNWRRPWFHCSLLRPLDSAPRVPAVTTSRAYTKKRACNSLWAKYKVGDLHAIS